jgi:tRNA(Arg) A34 adenosine deaminase TadA
MTTTDDVLCARLLDVIEKDIVPLTREGVAAGNKLFGAAILRKSDLSLVIAATNAETENPLNHGEISALNAFYKLPAGERPATRDCVFVSTHEPCSLCLSAITWAGFDNFYYFFGYEDTRDAFNIPHDLKILQEVFRIEDGDYARNNAFWECKDLVALSAEIGGAQADERAAQIDAIRAAYDEMSATYQATKSDNDIPLS